MTELLRPKRAGAQVAVLGIQLDHNSSFLRGPRKGPAAIRRAS